MIINNTTLEFLYKSANLSYQGAYDVAPTWHEQIASVVPSSSRINLYAWAKKVPALSEFLGERKISNLEGRSYELINKKYQVTIGVDRDDVEDDQLGMYAMQFQQLGDEAKKWPDNLLAEVIMAGASTVEAFDGQTFFNTSHPVDVSDSSKGTYSNNLTSTPLTAANYATARATMRSYVSENGKSMNVMPNLLVVPPALETTALQIINGDLTAAAVGTNAATGGATNVLRNSAKVLVLNELASDPTTWYLMDVSKPIKPFVFQMRRAPEFVSMVDPANPEVWKHEQFFYSVTARGAAGVGLPFLALRATA